MSLTFCTLEWYRLPTSVVRDMILVTIALNVPPKMTAGNIIDLSFRTFGDVSNDTVCIRPSFQTSETLIDKRLHELPIPSDMQLLKNPTNHFRCLSLL